MAALARCTSTTSSGQGTGEGSDASSDAVTIDDVSTCAATVQCAVVGSGGVNFDPSTACGACDACIASMCCDVATSCLAPTDAGGTSPCDDLVECEQACGAGDAGDAGDAGGADGDADCSASCESAYDSDTIAAFRAFVSCYSASCASACP
jgi:hypothetical protein